MQRTILQPALLLTTWVLAAALASPAAETMRSVLSIPVAHAANATNVTALVNPGLLVFTGSSTAALSNTTLNLASTQAATGNLGLMTLTDSRGSGAGWSVTATSSNFTYVGSPIIVSGLNALVVTGAYTGSGSGTYTVTITSGGILGTAQYAVSGLSSQAAAATGVGVSLGNGLSLTFANATYSVGDSWTIAISQIPVSDLTLTPSAVTAVLGSASGVVPGSTHTFANTSDATTIMSATTGSGLGSYTDNPGISLEIPPAAKSGLYTATITETAN